MYLLVIYTVVTPAIPVDECGVVTIKKKKNTVVSTVALRKGTSGLAGFPVKVDMGYLQLEVFFPSLVACFFFFPSLLYSESSFLYPLSLRSCINRSKYRVSLPTSNYVIPECRG